MPSPRFSINVAVSVESRSCDLLPDNFIARTHKMERDIVRCQSFRLYRSPDSIENMVAVSFDNHLNTSCSHFSQKLPHLRLAGRMQMHLGIFYEPQFILSSGQCRHQNWKHLSNTEANTGKGIRITTDSINLLCLSNDQTKSR